MIRGAIFDIDGTLLDTMSVWKDVGRKYLVDQGISDTEPGLGEKLFSMSMEESAEYMRVRYLPEKTAGEIMKDIIGIMDKFYRYEAAMKPGVKELLEWMNERKILMALATAGDASLAEAALRRNGIWHYFQKIFTCTEEGSTKHKPDIYLKAAEYIGSPVSETAVFEDILYAAETAEKAGFVVIGVEDVGSRDQEEEMKKHCICYCRNIYDCTDVL